MKRILFCIAFAATGILMPKAYGQTENDSLNNTLGNQESMSRWEQSQIEYYEKRKAAQLEALEQEKKDIPETEKFELKKQIGEIDEKLEKGEVNAEKAAALKQEAAKKAAQNIDNKTAIVDNQIALIQRDVLYNFTPNTAGYVSLGFGNATDNKGSFLLGVEYKAPDKKPKYDKRTYSDVVIKFGFANAVGDGRTIGDSYKFWGSGYGEVGVALKTRLLKDSNMFRLSYGLSYQYSMYGAGKHSYFVNDNGTTVLQEFPYELKNSFLRVENLIVPLILEFGPSVKKEYPDYFRYDTSTSYKIGIGGYAGINTGAMQRLQYKIDGQRVVDKNRSDYNVNKFVYGLESYIGVGAMSIFARYELNPIFENSAYKEHGISFGIRVDM